MAYNMQFNVVGCWGLFMGSTKQTARSKRKFSNERGASLVETACLSALVVLACAGAAQLLSSNVSTTLAFSIPGEDDSQSTYVQSDLGGGSSTTNVDVTVEFEEAEPALPEWTIDP